jgi:hypothetical protein
MCEAVSVASMLVSSNSEIPMALFAVEVILSRHGHLSSQ